MNERVEQLLSSIEVSTLANIAGSVLNDDSITIVGDLAFADIDTPHNDDRTIGIVKVSGTAVSGRDGSHQNWSSVVKIIDQSVPTNVAASWGFPENEVEIYELGLLADDEIALRPAKCYLTQQESDGLHILWLEDLSDAPQPPWALDHFINTANHLGQFNGYHFVNKTELPIEVTRDAYYFRMTAIEWHSEISKLTEMPSDDLILRRVFRDTPLEPGLEYSSTFERALEVVKSLPHCISFGDSHARNRLPLDSETVGIDLANLAYDPIGCDVGVLIGSPLSFSKNERQLTAQHEQEIYDSYIDGLTSSGWTGNLDHVRLGFFMQFSGYALRTALMPIRFEKLKANDEMRAHAEKRFGAPLGEFPELSAQVVELFPKYAEELRLLLDRVEASL